MGCLRKEVKINKKLIPAYIWGAIIFTISSIPYLEVPGPQNIGLDELAHCGVYLILGFLIFRRGKEDRARALCYVLIFAIIDELHQIFIPGRQVEFTDLIANFTGIFCAKLIALKWGNTQIRRENGNIQKTTASSEK